MSAAGIASPIVQLGRELRARSELAWLLRHAAGRCVDDVLRDLWAAETWPWQLARLAYGDPSGASAGMEWRGSRPGHRNCAIRECASCCDEIRARYECPTWAALMRRVGR